jgi:diguanylate cyclase (GGDEF)-like protein
MFDQITLSDSTWRLLYCLYGAPVLMMLCLPSTYRHARLKLEIFLDLFQVAIVVALVYSTFFFAPVQEMSASDALLRNLSISNAQSLLLLAAALARLHFARLASTRRLLLRLSLFLLVCAIATVIGDWIDLHHYVTAATWFNLGWAVPQIVAGLIATTWAPSREPEPEAKPAKFVRLLGTNLALVAVLCCLNLLMDYWKQEHGAALADAAIAASLFAFTLRLALTQFHQQQEISHRKAAQRQLTASNEKVGHLLDNARRQTAEITLISELGSLLQACGSREEVFRLIPERLRRLFPDASGCISLFSASRNRVECVAQWGITPAAQLFSPEECWALRRGSVHAHPRGVSATRCSHFIGEGASVCIPLIAGGQAVGMLAVQDNDLSTAVAEADFDCAPSFAPDSASDSDASSENFARCRHLAAAVAEHIALAIANLNLRESLRLEAIRDPLTGLYNRRYMQEFLDRELNSARRKHRPVAVMMLDLDHFKRYNDTYGHAVGDQALAATGLALLRFVRAEDVACRYGGEEFTLILPECTLRQAAVRAEEICRRIRECHTERGNPAGDELTMSIGVAAFDETTDRVDLLLKFADDALYDAKRAGRDRVVVARPAATLPEINFTQTVPTGHTQ